MIVYERLAAIEKLIDEAGKLPLSKKIIIDADELGLLVKEIKVSLPDELKQAKWINDERKKIFANAQVEADDIIHEAEDKIDEHEIVEKAKERAEILKKQTEEKVAAMLERAEKEAEVIKRAALEYTDGLLAEVQGHLDGFIDTIIENRRELK
ncbi:MAG: ATPase [Clostridia bacterium]|nr:ATPase [Clostridia bacterium]